MRFLLFVIYTGMCTFCGFMAPSPPTYEIEIQAKTVWQLNRIPVAGAVPACHSFKPKRDHNRQLSNWTTCFHKTAGRHSPWLVPTALFHRCWRHMRILHWKITTPNGWLLSQFRKSFRIWWIVSTSNEGCHSSFGGLLRVTRNVR